jgi:ribosomal 50S subunit-associated protein YjgA (DUF615 family)
MKRPFDTNADDDQHAPLLSRADARRAERELEDSLARLAKDLVELRPRSLEKLSLPELVLESVLDTQTIASHNARNRQMRVVRAALRDADWSLIRARFDALEKHGAIPKSLSVESPSQRARAPEWAARLIGEGATAVEALLQVAPTGDRVHLGNLIRRVQRLTGAQRLRAEERLTAAIESLLS